MKTPFLFVGTHLINPSHFAVIERSDEGDVTAHHPSGSFEEFAGVGSDAWTRLSTCLEGLGGFVPLTPQVLLNPAVVLGVKNPGLDESKEIVVEHASDELAFSFPSAAAAKEAYGKFVLACFSRGLIEPLSRAG